MPQSHARLILHITFSTKHRKPLLKPESVRTNLHAYIAGILQEIGCEPILINSVEDHIHILTNQSRTITVAKLLERIKSASSKWIKTCGQKYSAFSWQLGYGAFSVSQSSIPRVIRYIDNQPEHHRHITFQEEFRILCRKHNLQIDEKYVWD